LSLSSRIVASDLPNIIFGQTSATIALAKGVATFPDLVIDIVLIGSKERMIQGDASWVVATVQNHVALWYRATVQLKPEACKASGLAIDTDLAVAVLVERACPFGATRRLIQHKATFDTLLRISLFHLTARYRTV
jgi:hypothetical protein